MISLRLFPLLLLISLSLISCQPITESLVAQAETAVSPQTTSQQTTVWEPAGFGGAGAFITLHVDPNQPNVVYTTSDVNGVFRSSNNGTNWEARSNGLGNLEVSSFAIDPFNSNVLYAGAGAFLDSSKTGIYKSVDAGLNWQHLSNSGNIDFRVHRTTASLAASPHQQNLVISGSRTQGLWRSTNGGTTWSQTMTPPQTSVPLFFSGAGGSVVDPLSAPYSTPVTAVRFDPHNNGIAYATLFGAGIFKSSNNGQSWQNSSSGLPNQATVHDIAISADGTLFAALGIDGIYRSSDGGASWSPFNTDIPLGDFYVLSLESHPTDASIIYFSQEHTANPSNFYTAVWQTNNGGFTWFPLSGNVQLDTANSPPDAWWFYPISSWRVVVDPHQPSRLYYLLGGIYRSEDGSATWHNTIRGAQNTCVTDVLIDRDQPNGQPDVLYATHMDAGLLSSRDNGTSWQQEMPVSVDQRNDFAGHYWDIAITRSGGVKRTYITTSPWAQPHHQVLRSTDGTNWTPVFTETIPNGGRGLGDLRLAIDPTQPNVLYVAQDGGLVYRSTNHGSSWTPTNQQPGSDLVNDIIVDDQGRVFVSTFFGGLWLSENGGNSWRRVLNQRFLLWNLATAPGAVYVTAEDGHLYRSTNGGNNWNPLTPPPTDSSDADGTSAQGIGIGVNPDNPNHLLFSRYDTWHVADNGGEVLESIDGGASWTAVMGGLGSTRVYDFAFGRDGTRFAGTQCGSVWRTGSGSPLDLGHYLPLVVQER
ncbi:MAG: hypothetical protein AAF614_05400 [Chloroflexota bacterium]